MADERLDAMCGGAARAGCAPPHSARVPSATALAAASAFHWRSSLIGATLGRGGFGGPRSSPQGMTHSMSTSSSSSHEAAEVEEEAEEDVADEPLVVRWRFVGPLYGIALASW